MGLGVLSRPAGCLELWLRPRGVSAPRGTVPVSGWSYGSGDTSVALELWLRPPMWGDRGGPQQGEWPEKVLKAAAMHGLELWLRMRGGCLGLKLRGTANTRRYNRREKDSSPINQKVVPDRRRLPRSLSPAGGVFPPVGDWAREWASRESHDGKSWRTRPWSRGF
jgi:hypothetical protein